MLLDVLVPLEKYLDRKTRCRLRATCKDARDTVLKPKSLRHLALKLDTSVTAKIDLVLASAKVRCIRQLEIYDEVEIYIGYKKITTAFIAKSFKISKGDLFYFVYKKYRKFDMIATHNRTFFSTFFPELAELDIPGKNIIEYL
jgi:hypothetical protein